MCATFLRELVECGFQAPAGLLVVSDGAKGLSAAVRDVFGELCKYTQIPAPDDQANSRSRRG